MQPARTTGGQSNAGLFGDVQRLLALLIAAVSGPAFGQVALDPSLIEGVADALMDDIHDRFGLVIESPHRRQDRRAVVGCPRHETEVSLVQRRLTHHEHKRPALLERDSC